MTSAPEQTAPRPRSTASFVAALPTWVVLAGGLWWAYFRVDRWADRVFARPELASALVAVIELGLFVVALCLAPAISRVLRFGAVPVPAEPSIVLFDGVCGLCSRFVQFALRRDRAGGLRFAPLQGDAAARVLGPAGPDTAHPDSVAVIVAPGTAEQRVLWRSEAVLHVLEQLGGAWRLALILFLVPRPLRDWVYDRVAVVRYRLFGQRDSCMVPTERDRARFLD